MRITVAQLQQFVQRGMVAKAEADDVIKRLKIGAKRLEAKKRATQTYQRTKLSEPISFEIPLDLATENTLRAMHPIARGKALKVQRAIIRNAWSLHLRRTVPELPVTVTMVRIARRMDAHDSLPAAFKHVTDEITELLGLKNDDTEDVTWAYCQEPRGDRPKSIRICVESRDYAHA